MIMTHFNLKSVSVTRCQYNTIIQKYSQSHKDRLYVVRIFMNQTLNVCSGKTPVVSNDFSFFGSNILPFISYDDNWPITTDHLRLLRSFHNQPVFRMSSILDWFDPGLTVLLKGSFQSWIFPLTKCFSKIEPFFHPVVSFQRILASLNHFLNNFHSIPFLRQHEECAKHLLGLQKLKWDSLEGQESGLQCTSSKPIRKTNHKKL